VFLSFKILLTAELLDWIITILTFYTLVVRKFDIIPVWSQFYLNFLLLQFTLVVVKIKIINASIILIILIKSNPMLM